MIELHVVIYRESGEPWKVAAVFTNEIRAEEFRSNWTSNVFMVEVEVLRVEVNPE